jgi:hypothetical protein
MKWCDCDSCELMGLEGVGVEKAWCWEGVGIFVNFCPEILGFDRVIGSLEVIWK